MAARRRAATGEPGRSSRSPERGALSGPLNRDGPRGPEGTTYPVGARETPAVSDRRTRILTATYACVARFGLAKTTLEDAAREAGLSRATIYRYFPGGRDELIRATITWETARFFLRLYDVVAEAEDIETMMVEGIRFAHKAVVEHEVLQTIVATEPELLLPQLTIEADRMAGLVAAFLAPHLERLLGEHPPVEPDFAAEFLARMVISFIASPGRWDLSDAEHVRELVRTELLAGFMIA